MWQTAINPVVALELLDRGAWKGTGVLGPEAFPPGPFLELLAEYGLSAWADGAARLSRLWPLAQKSTWRAGTAPVGGGLLQQVRAAPVSVLRAKNSLK